MSIREIEAEALKLPLHARARLAHVLLESLDEADEIERAWNEEASRRAAEIRSGAVEHIPADDVFAEIRRRR